MGTFKLAVVVVLCMAIVGSYTANAIDCGQVGGRLIPCIGYLRGGGPVPGACCGGVKGLLAMARTTADRRSICNCLKMAASGFRGLVPANAESLPGKCGIRIPYKISTSINCNSIN
ncbi:non-specific lipid-transfer protein 1-like [Abrus precatorius]|uniref:Non-specific lipid-transfer protein n=1 Tax=Abrus precatorius TaxID=3816 RepID=A0A8B8K1F2_ABRPR|nr:non-specific lipid-transfer protein 1-like [Abrus precatorius]